MSLKMCSFVDRAQDLRYHFSNRLEIDCDGVYLLTELPLEGRVPLLQVFASCRLESELRIALRESSGRHKLLLEFLVLFSN